MSFARHLSCIAWCATTLAACPLAAAAEGPGPYYATPAWSQQLPAATRFVVLTNWGGHAVLDRETGLLWERAPQVTVLSDQPQAHRACLNRAIGGRKGWRLPSVQELSSLVDPGNANPALPTGHPFVGLQGAVLGAAFWTSTMTGLTADPEAWGVIFTTGVAAHDNAVLGRYLAWCVRGGTGTDLQGH